MSAAPAAGDLREQLETQQSALAAARDALATAASTRNAAAADLRSLEYVSGLTRDEAARRRSGNARALAAAEGAGGSPRGAGDASTDGDLQRAEAELLAAKAELAALRLSVDSLADRARPRPLPLRSAGADVRTTPRAAPRTPPASFARLIADVDVVVVAADKEAASKAAPARLGVTPAGNVALFGYHSPDPVHRFSSALRVSAPVPLADADERLLRRFLDTAGVNATDLAPVPDALVDVGEEVRAKLCGLREALRAARAVVNATSATPKVFEEVVTVSPRRGRRTFG